MKRVSESTTMSAGIEGIRALPGRCESIPNSVNGYITSIATTSPLNRAIQLDTTGGVIRCTDRLHPHRLYILSN